MSLALIVVVLLTVAPLLLLVCDLVSPVKPTFGDRSV